MLKPFKSRVTPSAVITMAVVLMSGAVRLPERDNSRFVKSSGESLTLARGKVACEGVGLVD